MLAPTETLTEEVVLSLAHPHRYLTDVINSTTHSSQNTGGNHSFRFIWSLNIVVVTRKTDWLAQGIVLRLSDKRGNPPSILSTNMVVIYSTL